MFRYHLIACFGQEPSKLENQVQTGTNTVIARIPFQESDGKLKYGIQTALNDLRKKNIYPSEAGIDAIILGMMVYIADMKISRELQSQDSWSREIKLTIPVFEQKWSLHAGTFTRMLKFLTGDFWEIEFCRRDVPLAQNDKIDSRTQTYTCASLFSGGMDSLIAAINSMEQTKPTLLISHAAEAGVRHSQQRLLSVLNNMYQTIPHENAYCWTNLDEIVLLHAGNDMNQRSRSFLFIAIALLAMSGTKNCTSLNMPENGLIALNVPLDSLRIGSHSTKTTHPFYLKLWNTIAQDIFGYTISNPYWNKTKGEMASECLNQEVLKTSVGMSFSCSSVNSARIRSRKSQHCGHCVPCIVRRAAMHKAFGADDPSEYFYSSVTDLVNNRGIVGEQIRSFQYAIAKLKDPADAKAFQIHKSGPLDMDEAYLAELADTYYRGLMEIGTWIRDRLDGEKC